MLLDQQVFQKKNPVHHQKKMEQMLICEESVSDKAVFVSVEFVSEDADTSSLSDEAVSDVLNIFVFAASVPVPG